MADTSGASGGMAMAQSFMSSMQGSGGGGGISNSMPSSPWAVIGQAADLAGSIMPQPKDYQGEKGAITAGMDSAYDNIANAAMQVPPWGTIVGGAMKLGGLANKGLKALGVGTDGQTTADAILGSNFLALTPFGLANSLGAKKTDTMEKDDTTWAAAGASYNGSNFAMDNAMSKQDKKYGLFSRKQMNQANDQIHQMGRTQNILSDIVGKQQTTTEILANQTDQLNKAYENRMLGGYNQGAIHSAKHGGSLFTQADIQRAHKITFNLNLEYRKNPIDFTDDVELFANGGQMTVIPEGALHKNKHHMDEDAVEAEITHKGIPVVSIAKDGQKAEQVAEIEHSEVIFSKDLTDIVEENRKKYHEADSQSEKDEYALIAGEAIIDEFVNNLDDRMGLFAQVKV